MKRITLPVHRPLAGFAPPRSTVTSLFTITNTGPCQAKIYGLRYRCSQGEFKNTTPELLRNANCTSYSHSFRFHDTAAAGLSLGESSIHSSALAKRPHLDDEASNPTSPHPLAKQAHSSGNERTKHKAKALTLGFLHRGSSFTGVWQLEVSTNDTVAELMNRVNKLFPMRSDYTCHHICLNTEMDLSNLKLGPPLSPEDTLGKIFCSPLKGVVQIFFEDPDFEKRKNYNRWLDENSCSAAQTMTRLEQDWERKYCGKAHKALRERIMDAENVEAQDGPWYAKAISLLQSSGMGKSRLVSEMGKSDFLIPFILRSNGQTGYPPKDAEITNFITFLPADTTVSDFQSRSVAILAASMKTANNWLESRKGLLVGREEVLKEWRSYLAPKRDVMIVKSKSSDDSALFLSQWRGKGKAKFCSDVVEEARKIVSNIQQSNEWIQFHKESKEKGWEKLCELEVVKTQLTQPAQKLVETLKQFGIEIVLFSFDESSNLFRNGLGNETLMPYTALRRVLGVLVDKPIWALFLSTESDIDKFAPAVKEDPSFRVFMDRYMRHPPFYAFPLDIEMSKVHYYPQDETLDPLRLPIQSLASFNEIKNMARIGRPLWWAYILF